MQQSAIMRRSEPSADLVSGFQSLVGGQASDSPQQRGKVLAIDVFHGEKVLAFHFPDVVNTANIRMRDLAGVPHLSMESGESRGIILERGWKKLKGYNIPKFEILSAIDFSHSATSL
jgi:hypothetical protein